MTETLRSLMTAISFTACITSPAGIGLPLRFAKGPSVSVNNRFCGMSRTMRRAFGEASISFVHRKVAAQRNPTTSFASGSREPMEHGCSPV